MSDRLSISTFLSAFFIAFSAYALDFTEQGEYVGSSDCRPCHQKFYELWSTSHHGKAMEAFSASLAATLTPMSEPLQIGEERFIVELDDQGGVLKGISACGEETRWRIRHVFGGRNVRYFLIPLDGGKLQVAPLAYYVHQGKWYDATASMVRNFQDGGPEDAAVHWTDRQLTFNTSCHDCHVSQLQKNYDLESDSYHTTWKEAGISCETCHGPAEKHVESARAALAAGEPLASEDLHLIRFHEDLDRAQRDATCGPCHAKSSVISDAFTPGELFFDHYDLIAYENRDFWPDGRDLGENYTQTGWMANPCAGSGQLECIHCHTSSGRFRFSEEPNRACLPCHQKRVNNVVEHSHHKAEHGVACIDCHMPTTAQAFMSRSDHTFRPPSPAATLEFGSPNACNLCHHDRDAIMGNYEGHSQEHAEWADRHVKEWFGKDSGAPILQLGRIIQLARGNQWDRLPEILAYLESPACDPPSAVAILRMLSTCPHLEKWPAIRRQLEHKHEWVRAAAAAALEFDEAPETTKALLIATQDRYAVVRIRAAGSLLTRDLSSYSEELQTAYKEAHDAYWESLQLSPDRWSSHYNRGIYFDRLGKGPEALEAYEQSMRLRDDVLQPVINAAMVHARSGDNTNAYLLLEQALDIDPENAAAHFNIALLHAENGKMEEAETHLRAALKTYPEMPQAAYNLGVLLAQQKNPEGLIWLENAALLVPENWNYASSCLYFLEQSGSREASQTLLKKLIETGRAPPEVYFTLARNYEQAGKISGAIEIYRQALGAPHLPMDAKRYASQMEQRLRSPNL